jgi:peptidoglycan/xylan/chitin deacetylase (PgdA/CDA1 family)
LADVSGVEATPAARFAEDAYYLNERYQELRAESRKLSLYYRLKPLMPRRVQLGLRRAYARRQAARDFPAWPIEDVLLRQRDERVRRRLRETGADALPVVGFWPEGRRFAAILTHDVEGPEGIENIPRVLEVERRQGFVSSWNFCGDWYPIPPGTFEAIEDAGCEVGLHGIAHDGRLFQDRATFDAYLPAIHRCIRDWGASGFRSPATHRNADWMPELGCLYDTSFPDSDPFEPQSGGCCSIFPFMMGDLVELPITLLQDHTLFEILREESIDRWAEKSSWIVENHGLINLLVHPDYVLTQRRLDVYEEFLSYLRSQEGGWHALPRDVARWWKDREGLTCEPGHDGTVRICGATSAAGSAAVWWARERDGRIVFDAGARVSRSPLVC